MVDPLDKDLGRVLAILAACPIDLWDRLRKSYHLILVIHKRLSVMALNGTMRSQHHGRLRLLCRLVSDPLWRALCLFARPRYQTGIAFFEKVLYSRVPFTGQRPCPGQIEGKGEQNGRNNGV